MSLFTGVCLIEVERIQRAIRRGGDRFVGRVFSEREKGYCAPKRKSALHFAGRFAAKAALKRALRAAGRNGGLSDFEVLNEPSGKPVFCVRGPTALPRVHLTITHTDEYALAAVILEV